MEQWKEIEGFKGYEVSNTGKIRNRHGRELSPTQGHTIIIRARRKTYSRSVAKLVASHFMPAYDPKHFCILKDRNAGYGVDNILLMCRGEFMKYQHARNPEMKKKMSEKSKGRITTAYKRLSDGKIFYGVKGLKEEYNTSTVSNVNTAVKLRRKWKGSKWEIIKLNEQGYER